MKRFKKVIVKAMAISFLLTATLTDLSETSSTEAATPPPVYFVGLRVDIATIVDGNKLKLLEDGVEAGGGRKLPVIGLMQDERLIAVDSLPFHGLFGVGSRGGIYALFLSDDEKSFEAVKIGNGDIPIPPPLVDDEPGFDIDPVTNGFNVTDNQNRSLLITNTGRLTSITGQYGFAPGDTNAGVTPAINALAYTPIVEGNPDIDETTLYGIDTVTDSVVLIENPRFGKANTVGRLGVKGVIKSWTQA